MMDQADVDIGNGLRSGALLRVPCGDMVNTGVANVAGCMSAACLTQEKNLT